MAITFDYSELCALLAEAGVDALVGMDASQFSPLSKAEKAAVLQAGRSKLSMRQDDPGKALVQVLAGPTAVLHATRVQAGLPDEHMWFFYTPDQTVQLQAVDEEQYWLTAVAPHTAVLQHVQQFLPLQPAPADLIYRVKVTEEDFLTLRDLATEWEEVPALEILEADGLDLVSARDLFDSAVAPEWRGIIECLTCQGQTVTGQSTLRVLQGAEVSWLIRPSADHRLLMETAQPGHYENALSKIWQAALSE
ncbi:MAG: hypothetical protein KC441_18465 [Anaerolineales bacterium]|nr:hypothetical protein [Anaerolineales bacterium]